MITAARSQSQDTLSVSIEHAEEIFLKKNLLLTAAQLNVDAQKAMEIQARLYPNPTFSTELHAYDTETRKVFNTGSQGQKLFALEQLILLGGKRKNEIALARQNTQLAALELEDLLRNLRYSLRSNLYSIYFNLRTVSKYDSQLSLLDTIINAYEVQSKKGNIPMKEVVRLKSTYMKLNNDKSELLRDIQDNQRELQLLLLTDSYIVPDLDKVNWDSFMRLPSLDSLQQVALQHRSDQKISELNKTIAGLNVKYQKSLAVPDLTIGGNYDQQSNAFRNQYNLTASIPIPLWHRNQGNIRQAEIQVKAAELNSQLQQSGIIAEVRSAWSNMQRGIQEYNKIRQIYNSDFADVFNGMSTNFLKQNISIVEFVDFFESYNETLAEVYRVRKQLAIAAENINYITSFPVY